MSIVDVIIPTFNRAKFVSEAIESVLNQSFLDLELLVVDDGSTDETKAIVTTFADPRLRYIYQANKGKGGAINTGIEAASGEYILKLDSDDWLLPGAIRNLLSGITNRPDLGVIAGGYYIVNERKERLQEVLPWKKDGKLDVNRWLVQCPILWQGALVRRIWVDRIGGFDTTISGPDDWDFGLRLAYAGCKMDWVRKPVFCYRVHEGMSIHNSSKLRSESLYILDKFFAQSELPDELSKNKDKTYSIVYSNLAGHEYGAGLYAEAQKDLTSAIELDEKLLGDKGKKLYSTIAWWSMGYLNSKDKPEVYIQNIINNLPKVAEPLASSFRKAWAERSAVELFLARDEHNWSGVIHAFFRILWIFPQRLWDRGIASVFMQAIFKQLVHRYNFSSNDKTTI